MRTLLQKESSIIFGGLTKAELTGASIGALIGGIYGTGFALSMGGLCGLCCGKTASLGTCLAFAFVGPVIGSLIGYGIVLAGNYIVERFTEEEKNAPL